jgi:hypothetical protein
MDEFKEAKTLLPRREFDPRSNCAFDGALCPYNVPQHEDPYQRHLPPFTGDLRGPLATILVDGNRFVIAEGEALDVSNVRINGKPACVSESNGTFGQKTLRRVSMLLPSSHALKRFPGNRRP